MVDVEIVVPVFNEETDLEPSVRRLHALPARPLPVRRDHHHRRQREHRRDLARSPTRSRPSSPACGPCTSTPRAAAARCTRCGPRRPRASSPTWTSTCRPTSPRCCRWSRRCCRGTATSRSARGCRGRRGWCAARSASSSPARYNLMLRTTLRARFSDAQCGFKAMRTEVRPGAAAARARHRPGSSTPSCWCWPSAAACASPRCRSTGSTTPTAGSTSSPPRWPTCAASPGSAGRWPAATCRCANCGPRSAATR